MNMISDYVNRVAITGVFLVGISCSLTAQSAVREYWVAAEKVSWNYAPSTQNLIEPADELGVWGETLTYTLSTVISAIPTAVMLPLYLSLRRWGYWARSCVQWWGIPSKFIFSTGRTGRSPCIHICLLYTSDAADE